jgi:energy-coupling factor transport system ATP-binding protein
VRGYLSLAEIKNEVDSLEPVIVFDNVHYTYPADEKESLCGVSLSIEKGSFVAVLGHNGSGKSTFAKHMNGILVPDEGRVLVEGLDTSDEERIIDVRRRVGMVFQNPDNQIVANVVEDDVAFAPENLGVEPKEIRERVDAALRQVGMYDYRMHAPHLLSGGQKQRVAIAGVIAMQPDIIVLDEPTAMLDPQGRREVVDTVFSLCRTRGMTVVYITHHMDECIDADRLIVMSNGCVMADGKPADIFANAELLRREGLEQPETARLLQDLRASGMRLEGEPLSVEDCAELIAQVLQSERSRS